MCHKKRVLPQGTIVPQAYGRKECSGRLPQEGIQDKDMLPQGGV